MSINSQQRTNGNMIAKVARGARSITKTAILRKDRLADKYVNLRLEICRSCPAGMVIVGKNGQPKSCGKLVETKPKGRRRGCGCILRFKARDRGEDCPLGYWPKFPVGFDDSADSRSHDTPTPNPGISPSAQSKRQSAIETPRFVNDVQHERSVNGRNRQVLDVEQRRQNIAKALLRHQSKTNTKTNGKPAESPGAGNGQKVAPKRSMNGQSSLFGFFDRVAVVNLDRRQDRLDQFYHRISQQAWPIRYPERFRAIDGQAVSCPKWWRAGRGAWGCHQSHVHVIEQALMDRIERILILEDDAFFNQDFDARLGEFLNHVPDDWDQVYLGGQHLKQRTQPPVKLNSHVVKCFNVNRTHAYALSRRGMEIVYRWITDYPAHAMNPSYHVDHRLGELHESGDINVYAPVEWLAGQAEDRSNICGRITTEKMWYSNQIVDHDEPFVAVMGLHRSGSSCLAGVLHKLGVHMGDRLQGYEPTGGYEAVGLAHLCETAFPFPHTELRISRESLLFRLQSHIQHVKRSARELGRIAGGKYPHLCAMGEELKTICGKGLKVIHSSRPLEESVASLQTRSRKSNVWLNTTDEKCEQVQRWLWECKQQFLSKHDHFDVEYSELVGNTRQVIQSLIEYLGLEPTRKQVESAVEHVRPELRKHVTGTEQVESPLT